MSIDNTSLQNTPQDALSFCRLSFPPLVIAAAPKSRYAGQCLSGG